MPLNSHWRVIQDEQRYVRSLLPLDRSEAVATATPIVLIADDGSLTAASSLALVRRRLGRRPWVRLFAGSSDAELQMPYGAFTDILRALATHVDASDPLIAQRYGSVLTSVVPGLADHPQLRGRQPLRSGLFDYCAGVNPLGLGEFYQGRNVGPWIVTELLHFVLDAADSEWARTGRVTALWLTGVHDTDANTRRLVQLLAHNAPHHPLAIWVSQTCCIAATAAVAAQALGSASVEVITLCGDQGSTSEPANVLATLEDDEKAVLATCALLGPGVSMTVLRAAQCWSDTERLRLAVRRLNELRLLNTGAGGSLDVPRCVRGTARSWLDERTTREIYRGAVNACRRHAEAHLYRLACYASQADETLATEYRLRAVGHAWALSAYDSALYHARSLRAIGRPWPLPAAASLFMGLLNYEAGRYSDAHQEMSQALQSAAGEPEQLLLHRLMGYNCVFGLHAFEQGLTYLRTALTAYKRRHEDREVAWVANSMAFALLHLGRGEEAVRLEREALAVAQRLTANDRFLMTILNLNLGRLHRRQAAPEAIAFVRASIDASRGELNPRLLTLLYVTLSHLCRASGQWTDAVAYLESCENLLFDIGWSAFSRRGVPLLAKPFREAVGSLDDTLASENDQTGVHLAFDLALGYARLGDRQRAEMYSDWIESRLIHTHQGRHVAAATTAIRNAATSATPGHIAERAETNRLDDERLPDVTDSRLTNACGPEVARMLAEGRTVGWYRTRRAGEQASMTQSYVLHDPRSAVLRARVDRDFAGSGAGGGVLCLPEGAPWFRNVRSGSALVVQEGTLIESRRPLLQGVVPIRSRVQVITPDCGELYRLLSGFCADTAVPMVAALGYRVAGEEVARTPRLALKYLLETTVDVLCCEDRIIEKRYGSAATKNLLDLRPRLSGSLVEARTGQGANGGLILTRYSCIKVGPRGYEILKRCDGTRTVGDLMHGSDKESDICSLFRRLRERNAIHFVM